ncbi:MAG: pentapeptide repeat-containing protein [Alphaproteobacteria bacterium]
MFIDKIKTWFLNIYANREKLLNITWGDFVNKFKYIAGKPIFAIPSMAFIFILLWCISSWLTEKSNEKISLFSSLLALASASVIAVFWLIRMCQTDKQIALTEAGQLNERFKDAVTLLGNENRSVRIGGLYTLLEISKSESQKKNPEYPRMVVEIICGFIRSQSQKDYFEWKKQNPERDEKEYKIYDDIQTALDVLFRGHLDEKEYIMKREKIFSNEERKSFDEKMMKISYLNLVYGDEYHNRFFSGVSEKNYKLFESQLNQAMLNDAYIADVNFVRSALRGANLKRSYLRNCCFLDADLKFIHFEFSIIVKSSSIDEDAHVVFHGALIKE